ncbi:MAG TPA: DUF3500 domain-containing protein [Opitutaceae bacterium]
MRVTPTLLVAAAWHFSLSPLMHAHDPSGEMAHAASRLLATLSDEQRAQTVIPFADSERMNWHFVPRERRGLPFQKMTHEQRLLTHVLVATGLSSGGYIKAVNIISLEPVLAVLENNPRRRDPELYYVTIFGKPGDEPWAWRIEGHHISLNFTFSADAMVVTTPQFYGANPASIPSGPRTGFRALASEEDLGRALVRSLSRDQRAKAVILEEVLHEIFNVLGRNETKPEGIAWADLDATQRGMLLTLVHEYTDRFRKDVADEKFAALEAAGLDKLHFAWAGPLEKGHPHYYRVQGGTFVIEFDNVQNGANHAHSAWRDFDRDFGADLLAEHNKNAHHP